MRRTGLRLTTGAPDMLPVEHAPSDRGYNSAPVLPDDGCSKAPRQHEQQGVDQNHEHQNCQK